MNEDRIEQTYNSIDQMVKVHGKPKPEKFGEGNWDAEKEFEIYKKQVGKRYTDFQWKVIRDYFKVKFRDKK